MFYPGHTTSIQYCKFNLLCQSYEIALALSCFQEFVHANCYEYNHVQCEMEISMIHSMITATQEHPEIIPVNIASNIEHFHIQNYQLLIKKYEMNNTELYINIQLEYIQYLFIISNNSNNNNTSEVFKICTELVSNHINRNKLFTQIQYDRVFNILASQIRYHRHKKSYKDTISWCALIIQLIPASITPGK